MPRTRTTGAVSRRTGNDSADRANVGQAGKGPRTQDHKRAPAAYFAWKAVGRLSWWHFAGPGPGPCWLFIVARIKRQWPVLSARGALHSRHVPRRRNHPDDAGQHACERRSVLDRLLHHLPPDHGFQRRHLPRRAAGAGVRAAHGVHRLRHDRRDARPNWTGNRPSGAWR